MLNGSSTQLEELYLNLCLTLIYAGFFWGVYSRGGALRAPPEKISHISQTVKASLMKFSVNFYLAIPVDLSLFGAKSHV